MPVQRTGSLAGHAWYYLFILRKILLLTSWPNFLNFWMFYGTHADLYSTFPLNFLQIARKFFFGGRLLHYSVELKSKIHVHVRF